METIIHYPVNATYLGNFKILVEFENGKLKICDFKDLKTKDLKSFNDLKREEYFKKFLIIDGILQWPNGFDCAPDFLYDTGKSAVIRPIKRTRKLFNL